MDHLRGSKKLLAAWERRVLTDKSVKELSEVLDKSTGTVDKAYFVGGERPTGVALSLTYSGDDIDRCGNDLSLWMGWLRRYGGQPRPPKFIIDGIPFPDFLRMELSAGTGFRRLESRDAGQVDGFQVGQDDGFQVGQIGVFDVGQIGGLRRS